jgi:hypothetical protein
MHNISHRKHDILATCVVVVAIVAANLYIFYGAVLGYFPVASLLFAHVPPHIERRYLFDTV